MRRTTKPSQTSPDPLPAAAQSREQLRAALGRRYAFGVAFLMAVLGYTAYQLAPGAELGVPEEVRRAAATALGSLVVAAAGLLGFFAFRRRFAELERIRNLRAQLTVYRVGETLERLDREEELVRCALDVIAEGTGLAHWAIYRRDEEDGVFRLTAVRGLPEEARSELRPDPIGPDAVSPATRAAWLLETIVSREPGAMPDYAFAASTPALGPRPIVVSVPLVNRGEAVGVLQCFVPRQRGFETDQLALVRWTASQLAVGLTRLQTERRDRMAREAERRLNEQLRQANARLEEARHLQQQFLADTSHELRTPLNSVIGFATLLEQGAADSPAEARSFARSIREGAEQLLGLLNDILDLAKMEAGRLDLRLTRGDGRDALRAAVDALAPAAGAKGLALRAEIASEALPFAHDPARLRQVMLNVLDNAVKFTDRGEIRVRAWRDGASDEIRVVVADTGVGIAPDRQPQIFTKFASHDGSYARRKPGTGLGLAISKGLVERMGGSIAVESDGVNRGTRVRLAFPAAAAPEPAGAAAEARR